MKSATAICISYLTDKYSLFLGYHFCGLKEKSTFNTLLTLQKKFYQV